MFLLIRRRLLSNIQQNCSNSPTTCPNWESRSLIYSLMNKIHIDCGKESRRRRSSRRRQWFSVSRRRSRFFLRKTKRTSAGRIRIWSLDSCKTNRTSASRIRIFRLDYWKTSKFVSRQTSRKLLSAKGWKRRRKLSAKESAQRETITNM